MTAFSKNTYSFPLDIKRRTGVKLLGVNGDTANRFIVTLQDAGVNLDLTGLYVRAVFRRSDGVTVLQSESDSPANITKTTGGVVTIDVLNGSFRDGDNEMEIQVLDGDPDTGDVLITSARMLFRVRKELNSDDATESSHEYTVLQQFIDGLGNMTVTVETLAAGSSATAGLAIGDDYSYELALGIPRGADGSDGVGIANIQALESIIDGSYTLKIVMTDSTIYTFPLPFYIMPAGGIPKTDLSSGVQDSLALADTALQEHQSLAGYAKQTWVGNNYYPLKAGGIPANDLSSAVQMSLGKADTALQSEDLEGYATEAWVEDQGYLAAPVTTSDIANGAVTSAKIAAGAVTGAKIAANTVENSNLEYMEPRTVKANNTGSEAAPQDVAFGDMTFVAPRGSGFAGRAGFVPAPTYNDREKFLRGDGTWQTVSGGSDNEFVATVGVTTFDELTAAMNAGKILGARYVNTTSDPAYGNVYTAWLYAFEPGGTADTYSSFTFTATNIMAGGTLYITASPGSNNSTDWEVWDAQPDLSPTQYSLNAVSSGGVYAALAEINQKLVGAMKYKGTKATTSELPSTGNTLGDVWHITADGSEWAWNGSAWENLGTVVDISGKQDTISDLETIRSGAAAGATAVQPAALTAYRTASAQDVIDGAQDTAIAAKYAKPSGGIPSSDMTSAVQTSLGKADTAYQKPSGGIPAADLASGVIPSVPSAATASPSALGTAAVGSSAKYAREDHVHAMPSASDVGAIAAPSSPTSGQFLVYNGSAWVAQTLSTWQGGNY